MKQDDELVAGERHGELSKDHEVSPEDLNTGPDTTENIEEVYESHFMSYRFLEDFISAHPGIQVIDRIEAGNLVKITYKIPTEMESEDKKAVLYDPRTCRRVTEEDQDHESERITKAMARMIWRKVKNLDIRGAIDAMEAHDRGTLEKLVDEARKRGCPYVTSPESDEKIRKAMSGWSKERNTDFPGAKQGEEWLEKQQEEQVRDSGDVMFAGVDAVRVPSDIPGERKYVPVEEIRKQGNVDPMMSREFLERYREPIVLGPDPVITPGAETIDSIMEATRLALEREQLTPKRDNKNVSQDGDKIPQDYYRYGNILKRMDDTHTRKNSDYGDAAYKGYKKYGDYYFLTQLHNKFTRLENLTINNTKPQVEDESIDDTLLDMANYAVMYLESRHRND